MAKINKKLLLITPYLEYSDHVSSKNKYVSYIAGPNLIKKYYSEPLGKIFSEVIVFNLIETILEKGILGANREILKIVNAEKPDYVYVLASGYQTLKLPYDQIKKTGATIVGSFSDDEFCFDIQTRWWASNFHYCITGDIQALPKYKKIGAKAILGIPMGGGVAVDRDWKNMKERYDVSFVGKLKLDRKNYIDKLEENGVPTKLFVNKFRQYVSYDDMIDIFQKTKINLNFSKAPNDRLGIKGRIFEVPLAGGFLLTEYVPGIENYFELDKEIVCFKTEDELVEKVSYYLKNEKERIKIAKAGWKKAKSKLTAYHSLHQIFSGIEKDLKKTRKKTSPKVGIPRSLRNLISHYYFTCAVVLSMENKNTRLTKEALKLSRYYNKSYTRARLYTLVLLVPFLLRRPIIGQVTKLQFKLIKLVSKLRLN